jgi:hypothetical protein
VVIIATLLVSTIVIFFACKFYALARRDFVSIEHMLCTAQHAKNKDKHLERNRQTASVYASLCLPSCSFFTAIKRCRLLSVLSTKEQMYFTGSGREIRKLTDYIFEMPVSRAASSLSPNGIV